MTFAVDIPDQDWFADDLARVGGGLRVGHSEALAELVQIEDAVVDEPLGCAGKVAVIDRVGDKHGPSRGFHWPSMGLGRPQMGSRTRSDVAKP